MFPIEVRLRRRYMEKAAMATGIKKICKKAIGKHYCDCGESVASLGPEAVYFEDSYNKCPEL
eukprot:1398834-Lingulodinium_polyedra.AAC.1